MALALRRARMTVRDKQPLEQMLAGCTHASLVPTQLWRLLANQAAVTLKAVLLGGAVIPVELTDQASKPRDSLLVRVWAYRVRFYGMRQGG
ncbi:O-succinylbenzoic acid-CoA ligase [Salmonella enterica subsp. diarizonae]|uniref:O-succinylbenzoic acid-CoA ligase n=1 Tax=Salmonella diarizonae TaxID=59204 RepID=A0A379TW66_SALDZ|nr:O-succinylbenzoic acid-CoA ligase [Salmonella enterica subsp. diarizonae]